MTSHVRGFDVNYGAYVAANASAAHAAARATSLSPPTYPLQSSVLAAQARASAATLTKEAVRASVSPTAYQYTPNVSAAQVNATYIATQSVVTSPTADVHSPLASAVVAADNAATRAGSYHFHAANSAELLGITHSARRTAEDGVANVIAEARARIAEDAAATAAQTAADAEARAAHQAAALSEMNAADAVARAAAAAHAQAARDAHAIAASNIAVGNANAAAAQCVHHGVYSGSPHAPRFC